MIKRIILLVGCLGLLASLPPDRATPVSRGGTGATSLTANNVVLGNGTSAVQFVAPGTSGNVLTSNGTTWASAAATGGGGGVFSVSQNLLDNTSWEVGTSDWTASGGTYTRTTTAANIIPPGVGAGDWDSDSASQTLTSNSTTVTSADGLSGRNLSFSCAIKAASGTATHTIQIYDGTNILGSTTIASSTSGFVRTTVYAPSVASGTISARLVSVASNEPEIYIDDCYFGLAEGLFLSDISQSKIAGVAYFPVTASCIWVRTNTALGAFGNDTDCPGPTIEYGGLGSWQTTDSDQPAWTINNLPPGIYTAIVTATVTASTATVDHKCLAVSDGTTTSGASCSAIGNAVNNQITSVSYFTYGTSGNRTFTVHSSSSANSIHLENNNSNQQTRITLLYSPLISEQAVRPEQTNWYVDANISGANVALSGTSQTAYVELTSASLTLTNNSGSQTAQIACASGTASTGTTCSSNESIGVAFNVPQAGPAEVCFAFGHNVQIAASATAFITWEVIETTNTSSAVVNEGKGRTSSGFDSNAINGVFANRICGIFNFASAGQKTIRLEYEQSIAGTVSTNQILADANTSDGQRDIHVTVRPITANQQAPILVGSVTSNSTGAERMERARVTYSGGTPSVATQSGSWVSSVTDNATGDATLVVVSGTFSSTPVCVCSVTGASTPGGTCQVDSTTTSTTAVRVAMRIYDAVTQNGTTSDKDFNVICMGPK